MFAPFAHWMHLCPREDRNWPDTNTFFFATKRKARAMRLQSGARDTGMNSPLKRSWHSSSVRFTSMTVSSVFDSITRCWYRCCPWRTPRKRLITKTMR